MKISIEMTEKEGEILFQVLKLMADIRIREKESQSKRQVS